MFGEAGRYYLGKKGKTEIKQDTLHTHKTMQNNKTDFHDISLNWVPLVTCMEIFLFLEGAGKGKKCAKHGSAYNTIVNR